ERGGGVMREGSYREGNLEFPLDELRAAIAPSTRAVLIANPNNPTGTAVSLSGIERVLKRARNAVVLVDEAYYEFCGVTALGLIGGHPNLFISRTFSKVYGMAGVRPRCLFSQEGNVSVFPQAQAP